MQRIDSNPILTSIPLALTPPILTSTEVVTADVRRSIKGGVVKGSIALVGVGTEANYAYEHARFQ